jgi:protein O-mannosyl-transferase
MSSAAVDSGQTTSVLVTSKPALPCKKTLGLSLVLVFATSLLYLPIIHHPFANMDDSGYVYQNLYVQDGLTWETIKWAALSRDDNNWHPLTWLSIALDCQMFGIDPAGHHAMAIVYHAIDGVVLFWVLLLATGYIGRSFMVAALFALHPINVESVAWAAERKTLLSTLLFLLALGAYRWYARQPGIIRYCVVAALFTLGLMAKPQIITLPCVLLLWDYWPLRRVFPDKRVAPVPDELVAPVPSRSPRWLLLEKLPLLVICAASALATMKAQGVGRPQGWQYTIWIRTGNAIVSYVRYIGKAFWPSHLAIMYLHPGASLRFWQVAVCAVVLLVITGLVLVARRYRYLPVGWFWFVGTLVPTIGLIQVGRQAMADRYAYQSFLGLFIIACWGAADWVRLQRFPKVLLPAVSIGVLAVLSVLTYRQIGYWQDNLTLWSHALKVTDNNWMAHDMVAAQLMAQGHTEEGMAHYWAANAILPTDASSNLAIAIYEQNHHNLQEAVRRYKHVVAELEDPNELYKAYINLAVAYRDLGDTQHMAECMRKAVQFRGKL